MAKNSFLSKITEELKKRKNQQETKTTKPKNNSSTLTNKIKTKIEENVSSSPKVNKYNYKNKKDVRNIKTDDVKSKYENKKVNYYVRSKSGQYSIADIGTLDKKTAKKNLEAKKKEKSEALGKYVQKSKEINKKLASERLKTEKSFDDLRFNNKKRKKLEDYFKNPEFLPNTDQKNMERRTKAEADKIALNNTKEGAEYTNAKNQKNLAKTMYDVERLNDDNIGWFDKTLGIPGRAVSDLFSNVTGDKDYTENGRTVYLPSYSDMKQEKVSDSYKHGWSKFLGDAGYNVSKIGASTALEAASRFATGGTVGVGSALYWSDMALDDYKSAYNQTGDATKSFTHALINTAAEGATGKLLGGATGKLTGGSQKTLSNAVGNVVNKVSKQPWLAKAIGNATAEGTEEFLQEYIGALNDKLTIDKNKKVFSQETLENALYSGLVGMVTGGVIGEDLDILDEKVINKRANEIHQNNLANGIDSNLKAIKEELRIQTMQDMNNQIKEIQQQALNGEIDYAEANEKMQEVKNGTYAEQNLLKQIAQQQANEVINDPNLSPSEKTQQLNAITQTLAMKQQQINQNTSLEQQNVANNESLQQNSIINQDNRNKSISADFANEIQNKTRKTHENNNNVEFVPINDLIPSQKNGGYRTNEQITDLENNIKQNGIVTPIEISIDDNGKVNIENGNHRLLVANELGLKEVPVVITNNNLATLDNKEYNNDISNYWEVDNVNENSNENVRYNEGTRFNEGYSSDNRVESGNRGATTGNDRLSNQMEGYNNGSSSTTTRIENSNEKSGAILKDKGTSDSSFSNDNIAARKDEDVIKIRTKEDVKNTFDKAKKGELDGKQLRSWVETSNNATDSKETIKQADIDKITYESQSNKKTYEKAKNNIKNLSYEEQVFRASDKLNSNKRVTVTDLVEAQLALREAATRGDIKAYLNLQQDIAIMGTELGQATQALSMIQKMSPDGQLAMLNKIVDRQQKLGNKNWEGIELNPDKVQKVLDSYDDDTHTTFNKKKMDKAVNDLKQDIADQIKTSRSDKVNEWRYLSMLGNPKTHIRNVLANIAMSGVKTVKDFNNAALQDLLIKDSSKKTTTLKKASKDVKNFAKEMTNEVIKGEHTSKYNEKNDIESRKQVFKFKPAEKLRKANARALEVEDNWFKAPNFKKSFAKYLTAQGIKTTADIKANPKIVEQAKIFALEEAKIATFQQDNAAANWINDLDKKGSVAKVVRGAVIPFTRTPLNIAKTGIEYTPGAGLLKVVSDYKKAPSNMKGNVVIDGISKQITGTALALVGYALAKSGYVTADTGDDKEDKLETDQGMKMGYSIKLGNKSYDLSWLSPSSMPFFVGASMYEQLEENDKWDGNVILESLTKTLDPLSEMSCIKSFTDVLKSYNTKGSGMISDMGTKTFQNYLSQFVPTVSSQFARLFDDTKRSTYADKNSSFALGQETIRQLMYKIPGARNMLPEQTDYLGNSKKENENIVIRALESFFSPANTKNDTADETTRKLLELYKETGKTEILPGRLDQYVSYQNEKYNMTQKEYNQYKKIYGDYAYEQINSIIDSNEFLSKTTEDQAAIISNIMGYAKDRAKKDYLDSIGVDYKTSSRYSKAEKAENSGYAIADYYLTNTNQSKSATTSERNRYNELKKLGIDGKTFDEFKNFVKNTKADRDSSGKTIRGSKKQKIINYIQSLPLTAKQKENLYNDYLNNSKTFQTYN